MARRQKNPILLAAETWLNANPGKKLKHYYAETGYDGPPLKTKQRAGQPAVASFRSALSTSVPGMRRNLKIKAAEKEYIDYLISQGYSQREAKKALKISKEKTNKIKALRTALNKEKGSNTFTLGHQTAAAEGGGDFGRNTRLELGLGEGGNFSRGANDEMPSKVKQLLGVPSSGKEAAQMDLSGEFDRQLTPKDRQDIIRNPEKADEIISNRRRLIASNPKAEPLNVKKTQSVTERIKALKGTLPDVPVSRKKLAALAAAGLVAPDILGAAASAAETHGRTQLAMNTNDLADWLQAGISGLSLAADFVPVFGEAVSTPADMANMMIDQHRNGGSGMNGREKENTRNGNGHGSQVKVGHNNGNGGRSGAKRKKLSAYA